MSTRTDPLSRPGIRPDRPHYALGMLLAADDFEAEQTYHRGRLARALAYLHGSGTMAGLRVTVEAPEEGEPGAEGGERVTVGPGVALDRLGRLVEVPRPACIRLGRWLAAQEQSRRAAAFTPKAPSTAVEGTVPVDVFIRFVLCENGKTPAFRTGPYDALDAVVASRVRDGYELSLRLRQEDAPPLPASPWPVPPEGATPEERLELLRDALLDTAWREGTIAHDRGELEPLPEHAVDQNPEELFLARLRVPVRTRANPVRDTAREVQVDNHSRRFAYPTGALAHWLGL